MDHSTMILIFLWPKLCQRQKWSNIYTFENTWHLLVSVKNALKRVAALPALSHFWPKKMLSWLSDWRSYTDATGTRKDGADDVTIPTGFVSAVVFALWTTLLCLPALYLLQCSLCGRRYDTYRLCICCSVRSQPPSELCEPEPLVTNEGFVFNVWTQYIGDWTRVQGSVCGGVDLWDCSPWPQCRCIRS